MCAAALAAIFFAACLDLVVDNPNAPDAPRAFSDPAALEQLLGATFRTWVQTRGDYFVLPLNAMADNYTASWNSASLRYYSSVGADCPSRCGWTNSETALEAAGAVTVQSQWYGFYAVLSSANDVRKAIAGGLCFDDDCQADNTLTSRNSAVAKMVQGMALAGIALLYDQGFVIDETTDLTEALKLPFNTRVELRDAALEKFDEAYDDADGTAWSTPSEWMGVGAGTSYTNGQIRQVIRTMEAELIALWPRNGAENAQADWGRVVTYTSQGISNPPPGFDFQYYIDPGARECGVDCIKTWGNSIGSMRVDTRVASLLATNHLHPWPEPDGNPCPTTAGIYGVDKRMGDGTWGPSDNFNGYATIAATPDAGTDFACSGVVIFPPGRGQYHQSNLGHVRYGRLGYRGETLPTFDGTGQDPFYTVQMNDLLWAEGLIRSSGDRVRAAQLINNSRVGRGGLPPLTGSESDAELLAALYYEQEIEFMGQWVSPLLNRRRIDSLIEGTPRQMPVPAKELAVLGREIYTFGGPDHPDMALVAAGAGGGVRVRSVREIWEEYRALARALASRRY